MFTGTKSIGSNTGICEALEDRRLLSASLLSGVLTIKGSVNADSIVLSLKDGDSRRLSVDINGVKQSFMISALDRVVVYGNLGPDLLKVDNLFGTVPLGVVLKGGDGNDLLIGGNFMDELLGGLGDDELRGGLGNDILNGEEGFDHLLGSLGNDLLIGGLGNDILEGSTGNDILKGGFGDDLLKGGAGMDHLLGEDGLDRLLGELGDDWLEGGLGDDDLDGGDGFDKLIGGLGNDDFIWDSLLELIDRTLEDVGDNLNGIF